jgi:hypothetical protein
VAHFELPGRPWQDSREGLHSHGESGSLCHAGSKFEVFAVGGGLAALPALNNSYNAVILVI